MKRLNITIPDSLAEQIKDVPKKSSLIALQERLKRLAEEKLDSLLIEGYKATRREDRETNEQWKK